MDNVTFWRGTGSARRGQDGIYGKLGKRQSHLCCATLEDGRVLTGTMSGHLYVWDCRNCVKTVKAHDKSVNVLFVCKHGIITGGRDGKVRLWSASGPNIEPGAVFDIGGLGSFNPRVKSVCWSADGAKLLVGTMGSELYEISAGDGSNFHAGPVLQGHCRHEVRGLAMSPIKPEFCTVGDDQTVRIWDMKTRALIKMVMLDTMARCCRYSPDGMVIVIGLGARVEGVARQKKMGAYIVLDSSDLTITHEARDSKEPLSDIKFSGDGKTLAVATLDSSVYLYNVEDYTSKGRCKGHSGGCEHIDFSVDDQWLHSSCDNHEMLFWNAYTGEQHKAIGSLRDIEWTTWTTPLGWHVQGLWPKLEDPVHYDCADRSGDTSVIVTGDTYGRVSLRRFPCVESGAAAKHHYGHASAVRNVAFSPGDRYVVSVGGADRCIFQWKHVADDAEDEAEEFTRDLDSEDEADYLDGDQWDRTNAVARENDHDLRTLMELEEKQDADAKADDFRPVKPWEGSVVAPTNPPPLDASMPDERLELEWVHGLRCDDVRENVRYTSNGSIAYFTGKLAIVFNKDGGGLQRYYAGHADCILSLAIHEEGQIVATGDLGRNPEIHIWDSTSLLNLTVLKGTHRRGVNLLRFGGSNGNRLVSCGLGKYHNVCLWDWQNSLLLASFQGGLQKVLCIDLTPDGFGIVQCGVKHIKFHSVQGCNVVSQRGLIGRKGKVQTMLCIGWVGSRPVIGTQDGRLYCFEGRRLIQTVIAHETSVNCVYSCSEGLVSGGKDGKVKVWSTTLECKREISMADLGCVRPSLRSVHWNSDDNRLLVAARSCEIFELSSVNGNNLNKGPVVQGHFAFEVWGLAMHPVRKEFVTVGDDQTVRVWSIAHRRVLRQTRLDTIGRAIAYDPSGTKIVVGLGGRVGRGRQKKDGAFVVLDEVDLKIVHEARDAKQWISDVKFSPDHNTLAIASHDNNVYVYDVPNAFELRAVMDKHNSFVHSLDFSADSQYIQSVCGAFEFIISDSTTGVHVPAISTLKDVRWDTWTCNLGWPVQGLWPKHSEGTDLRTVDRSHYGSLVAAGDGFGKLTLRRYPSLNKSAAYRSYHGHGQRINRVRFTPEDDYVVSVGGEDRAIFQWRVVPAALDDAMKADESGQDSDLDVEGFFDVDDDDDEQFMAIKPWVGSIVPPTVAPISSSTPPNARLELEHVYGRRAQDVRNNLMYAADGRVVYHTAALGIIYDKVDHRQQFYTGHEKSGDIMSMAISRSGHYVATGDVGKRPRVHIWDAQKGQSVAVLPVQHRRGVAHLAFSQDGKRMCSVGHDVNHTHCVWYSVSGKWTDTVLQATHHGSRNKTLCVSFVASGDYQLVSGGVNHMNFWTLSGCELHCTKGLFGRKGKEQPIMAVATLGRKVVTGTVSGHFYVWEDNVVGRALKAHDESVNCIRAHERGFISCGKEGTIKLWDGEFQYFTCFFLFSRGSGGCGGLLCFLIVAVAGLKCVVRYCSCFWVPVLTSLLLLSFFFNKITTTTAYVNPIRAYDARDFTPAPHLPSVRACDYDPTRSCIIVGTKSSEVYEICETTGNVSIFNEGHFKDQLHGCAMHPTNENVFVTAGDDCTIRIWDMHERRMLKKVTVDTMCRAIEWSPDGTLLGCGLGGNVGRGRQKKDGAYVVVSTDSMSVVHQARDSREYISDAKFSPDGKTLGLGSFDNKVYLYDVTKDFALRAKCEKHHSYITHFDFSDDSTYLQSNCGGYELQFFSVVDGEHVHSASITKDCEWQTQTSTLGWAIQAIWPEYVDGVEINSCDRSHNQKYIATADDAGRIKMFRYPTLQKGCSFIQGMGHTQAASKARFSADDARLITTGMHDRSIFQYRVVVLGGPGEDGGAGGGGEGGGGGGKKKGKGKKKKGKKKK